jgi:hypothetical protein
VKRMAAAVLAGLLSAACGGGGSSPVAPNPTPTPAAPTGGDASKLVVLDAGNFDALVLATPRPSLVKFQSPT